MNNQDLSRSLLSAGYKDYIAGRVLLNAGYPLQGLTLASSAVEKHIKFILAIKGYTKKVHMDRYSELKKVLIDCNFDITKHIDERFLDLLSKAYKSRYYDNLDQPLMIGFFINQVLCELDFVIYFFNKLITISDNDGLLIKTYYQRATENREVDLTTNNYIFLNTTKKEFMERVDKGFGIYIDSVNGFQELEIEGFNVSNKYDGTIAEINLKFIHQ